MTFAYHPSRRVRNRLVRKLAHQNGERVHWQMSSAVTRIGGGR
jgi:hypothetical protein